MTKPNHNTIRQFPSMLTEGRPSAVLSFQSYPDHGTASASATSWNCWMSELDGQLSKIDRIQEAGGAVSVAVNELDDVNSPRRSQNMIMRRALVVDVDAKSTDAALAMSAVDALRPHVIVHTGGGFHAWWWLSSAEHWDSLEWLGLQAALAQRVGGDPAAVNQALVMRLAGTVHQKRDPVLTTLTVHSTHPRLSHADVQAMGLEPLVVKASACLHHPLDVLPAPSGVVSRVERTVMAPSWPSAVEGHGGDATLWSVAVLCAQNGLNEVQTLDVLTRYNAAKARPPFSDMALRHKAERARLWRLSPQCPAQAKAQRVMDALDSLKTLDRPDVMPEQLNEALTVVGRALAAGGWDVQSVAQIGLQALGLDDSPESQREFMDSVPVPVPEQDSDPATTEQDSDPDSEQFILTRWKDGLNLDTSKDGAELPSDFNLGQYLEHAPILRAVAVDRCSGDFRVGSTVIPCGTVTRWVMNAVRLHMGGPSFRLGQVKAALDSFDFPVFCPVADWLTSLRWDGVNRIPSLVKALALDDTPLNRSKVTVNLVGAVRRALDAGCKHDTVLTLMGDGGLRKSSALSALFGRAWFIDNGVDPSAEGESAHRTNAVTLSTVWAAELAELVAVRRGDSERVKAYLTASHDKVRTLFTQATQTLPRRSVFVATFNPDNAPTFTDEALARRFHIVHVRGVCDTAFIETARGQLWAQFVHMFHTGTRNWLDDAEQTQERDFMRSLFVSSPVDELLSERLRKAMGPRFFIPCATLAHQLQVDPFASNAASNARKIAAAARALGWTQGHKRVDGVNTRVWIRPPTVSADVTDELEGAHHEVH